MADVTTSPSLAPSEPYPLKPNAPPKLYGIDIRFVAPILITCILLAGQLTNGVLESYPKTLLAIGVSIVTEIILGKLFTGKIPHLASAYVTGISVGILTRSPEYWPFAVCSLLATSSKYLFRYQGRHIFNPSNFGIVLMLLLASDSYSTLSIQWGNSVPPMLIIWALGSFIIYRLHRFHITGTYVVSFIAFALLRAAINHQPWQAEVAPITGPMYQLFIFFMITDPKTTVSTRRGQMLVAFLVAFVEGILRLAGSHSSFFLVNWDHQNIPIHAGYYALFLVGPIAYILDINRQKKQPDPKPA